MEKKMTALTIQDHIYEKNMTYEGTEVLRYHIRVPFLQTVSELLRGIEAINSHYTKKAESLRVYSETTMFKMAVENYKFSYQVGNFFRPFEFSFEYEITANNGNILSLFMNQYEYAGGTHGNLIKSSDTWNVSLGTRLSLSSFFPGCNDVKGFVLDEIDKKIAENPDKYFSDAARLAGDYFDEKNFYIVSSNIHFYYQLYEIAPQVAGIPIFIINPQNCIET